MYCLISLNHHKAYNKKATVLCSSVATTFSCVFFTSIFLNNRLISIFLVLSLPVLDIIYYISTTTNEKLSLSYYSSLTQTFYPLTRMLCIDFLLRNEGLTLYPPKYTSSSHALKIFKITFFVRLVFSVYFIIPIKILFTAEPCNILLLFCSFCLFFLKC